MLDSIRANLSAEAAANVEKWLTELGRSMISIRIMPDHKSLKTLTSSM
jgi:hypothetical protein